MNKKILILTIMTFFLITIMVNLVSSEIYLWNSVTKDNSTSVVKYHAFYKFEDTSARGIGKQKDVPITLWYVVEALPYNLVGYGGQVDWCNLTTRHYHNIYGTTFVAWQGFFGGELLNTTTETQSFFFQNTNLSSDKVTINMRDRDSLTADMTCHYTNSSTLYIENVLVGRFTTFMPSFECEGCTQYSLEELSYQTEKNEEITANELAIYDKIQTALSWNFQIWLIISWIIKIAFVLIAVGLIFAGVYYFYIFLKNIGREI
jgi:hypothetical protein